MTSIAERFLLLRGKVKQGDFARDLGINPNTLRNYENGRVFPNQKILERICIKCSISPAWLLLGSGSMYLNEEIERANTPTEAVQHIETTTQNTCQRCVRLEKELAEERAERREISLENRQMTHEIRQLWKEHAALREELAVLKTSSAKNVDIEERRIA